MSKNSINATPQQQAIIQSEGNIKINAVAGSGKTTTLVEYAATRPAGAKILYLAFNKSVKQEAERKYQARSLFNVEVHTAHSLAYKHIMKSRKYNVKVNGGYKTHEIVDILQLQGNNEKHTEYVIANHINKFITYFCNSAAEKVQHLNYLDTITDGKAEAFVRSFYKSIEDGARFLLAKMDSGQIDIIHDFYLKKFQTTNPALDYNYILFDEAQDASPVMLDIFLKQKALKVIVGDTHQQIYSWRHAVNSLENTNFQTLQLSTSFRFPQPIADLAKSILSWKKHIGKNDDIPLTGKGSSNKLETQATLGRTNLGLLIKAIDYITDNRDIKGIYFEGNFNSYTYAEDGASLYDVLNLFNHNHAMIKDKLIKSMNDIDELEEYIEKTEDKELGMMMELVKEYRNEIFDIIKRLKELHVKDEERSKAQMIFSTVHKAKGIEYDIVHLANDFITEGTIIHLTEDISSTEPQPVNYSGLNEEINLLYVAVTRTMNKLYIPDTLLPNKYTASPNIHVVTTKQQLIKTEDIARSPVFRNPVPTLDQIKPIARSRITSKSYTLEGQVNKDAYTPWNDELDQLLKQMYNNGASITSLAEQFGRTKGAVILRLKKLNISIF
jgi:F-box protein 18 (helicase)